MKMTQTRRVCDKYGTNKQGVKTTRTEIVIINHDDGTRDTFGVKDFSDRALHHIRGRIEEAIKPTKRAIKYMEWCKQRQTEREERMQAAEKKMQELEDRVLGAKPQTPFADNGDDQQPAQACESPPPDTQPQEEEEGADYDIGEIDDEL